MGSDTNLIIQVELPTGDQPPDCPAQRANYWLMPPANALAVQQEYAIADVFVNLPSPYWEGRREGRKRKGPGGPQRLVVAMLNTLHKRFKRFTQLRHGAALDERRQVIAMRIAYE